MTPPSSVASGGMTQQNPTAGELKAAKALANRCFITGAQTVDVADIIHSALETERREFAVDGLREVALNLIKLGPYQQTDDWWKQFFAIRDAAKEALAHAPERGDKEMLDWVELHRPSIRIDLMAQARFWIVLRSTSSRAGIGKTLREAILDAMRQSTEREK